MSHRPFREQDLVFFSATTASVSHELKNVITIINESAGLLNDFAVAAERGRPLDPQRVKKTSLDISRNVARAVDIINRLNRFAHSADEPLRATDLNQLVLDVVALAGRFAGMRGMQLQALVPEEALTVPAYAFGLHQVVFQAVRVAAAVPTGPSSGVPVTVALERRDRGALIRVSPVPDIGAGEPAVFWSELAAWAAEIGVEAVHVAAAIEIRVAGAPAAPGG